MQGLKPAFLWVVRTSCFLPPDRVSVAVIHLHSQNLRFCSFFILRVNLAQRQPDLLK